MIRKLSTLIALLAAVQILGGHWIALQSAAWVQMVITYAQTDSLGSAIQKTFDGSHPCDMCKIVTKGRTQDQKQDVATQLVKFEAILGTTANIPDQFSEALEYEDTPVVFEPRTHRPPTPPPTLA